MQKIYATVGDASRVALESDILALTKGIDNKNRPFVFRINDSTAVIVESILLEKVF